MDFLQSELAKNGDTPSHRKQLAKQTLTELGQAKTDAAWIDVYLKNYHKAWVYRFDWPSLTRLLYKKREPDPSHNI